MFNTVMFLVNTIMHYYFLNFLDKVILMGVKVKESHASWQDMALRTVCVWIWTNNCLGQQRPLSKNIFVNTKH